MADINSGSARDMAYREGARSRQGRATPKMSPEMRPVISPQIHPEIQPEASAPHAAAIADGPGSSDGPEVETGRDPQGEDTLIGVVELLFFAYRDFTGEADAVLEQFGFGRAHHRVLHFVNRRPGLRVADLLDILRITKQSLARVLKELVDREFIIQEAGAEDRRERRLYPTPQGQTLADRLADLQTARIRSALDAAGPTAEEVTRAFLSGMIGPNGSGDARVSTNQPRGSRLSRGEGTDQP